MQRRDLMWMIGGLGALVALLPATDVKAQRDDPGAPVSAGAPNGGALRFDGLDDYVTMGPAPGLNTETFTLELWLFLEGDGTTARTDTPHNACGPGVDAYPLVTKGRMEGESALTDLNYFLGIHPTSKRLVADFEDGEFPFCSENRVVTGSTRVLYNRWYHVAATYDGDTWRLYLNGILDGERRIALRPQEQSEQHFALGSALDSLGQPEGSFLGMIDEVRVWDHGRSGAQIRAAMNTRIDAAPGLIGSWNCDDPAAGILADASGNDHDGQINGALPVAGAPLDRPLPPEPAGQLAPVHDQSVTGTSVDLSVTVSDQDSPNVDVTIYGRLEPDEADAFTIAVLPDTQAYLPNYAPLFLDQTEWIAEQREALDIACVVHVGDIVNVNSELEQWTLADQALSVLDAHPDLPRGLCLGNHDGAPDTTENFNTYFPVSRYESQPWYGSHYGIDNDNHYVLFTARGQDYILLSLEFGIQTLPAQLAWATAVLQAHSDRKAIVATHSLLLVGEDPPLVQGGQVLFDALVENENLFLMLCGHIVGEGRRTDVIQGRTVHTVLANYQSRRNGGNGWLRAMSIGDDYIRVRTYSPTLDQFERDPSSEFILGQQSPFVVLDSLSDVAIDSTVAFAWNGLEPGRRYSWYVEVSDGTSTVRAPTSEFVVVTGCVGDIDGNGNVGLSDLSTLLAQWGECSTICTADLNGDGRVEYQDLTTFLAAWGAC